LASSTWAPIARSSAGVTPFTAPAVPTTQKNGVSTLPWGVTSVPARARLSRATCSTSNRIAALRAA
jgi:hypothetical protein